MSDSLTALALALVLAAPSPALFWLVSSLVFVLVSAEPKT